MHYASPLSLMGHHTSTSCTSSHSMCSMSPVSHRIHHMKYIKMQSFPEVLFPQWALGDNLYQWFVDLTIQCFMCPHWAPRATIFQHPVYLAIPGVLGPQWTKGATICPDLTISACCLSPMSPASHFKSMVCRTSHAMHYASTRSQHISKFYTFSHSGRTGSPVSRKSHYMSHVQI